ncbi:hypothetical protein AVEN_233758-1 [Araneus ventricosus]|uniref:DDE Tnp4 domain-containing protein n=1 Tax=Araneus ventricosus TaxID=182803 RepID=A0A4Y2RN88_ARAVE|nr:hypothetical protein AVEN_233758-1 [Araneus ventricosus]
MRYSLLPSIKTNMTDDDLSYLDDIESLEILEIIERRKRSVHPDRANDLDCMDNVSFRSRYRLNKDTAESLKKKKKKIKSPYFPLKVLAKCLLFFYKFQYNVAHKAARNVVERQYGIMKRRFACLATSLRCSLQNAMTVIVAIAVLHNMALQMDDVFEEIIEEDDEGNTSTVANHAAGLAKRNALLSTFFNN